VLDPRMLPHCILLQYLNTTTPVTVAVRSEGVGLDRLVAGIVGSNPAQGMDVCPRLSVLCCPV
jgi:hypothetical protein